MNSIHVVTQRQSKRLKLLQSWSIYNAKAFFFNKMNTCMRIYIEKRKKKNKEEKLHKKKDGSLDSETTITKESLFHLLRNSGWTTTTRPFMDKQLKQDFLFLFILFMFYFCIFWHLSCWKHLGINGLFLFYSEFSTSRRGCCKQEKVSRWSPFLLQYH